jgi:type IV pilus assembly protein PilV
MTLLNYKNQRGASLIEVLVAILILSFGMLSLGAMLSFSVQMPKLSGYRTTATNLATDHIERIRANASEFAIGSYISNLSYDGTFNNIALADCAYPNCSAAQLATMDTAATRRAARVALPAGGMIVTCDGGACGANSYGNLWIVWQEPSSSSVLNSTTSDNCPVEVTGTYTNPAPRCLYIRFKI